jgi:hypothetical protein
MALVSGSGSSDRLDYYRWMKNPTIAFSYPRRGLTGEFNTFRLGRAALEKYPPGTVVDLIDSRSKKVLKSAAVVSVCVGTLTEMATLHSAQAHNWKDHPQAERAGLLVASMIRRYPPGRAHENSICSVIYLKEIMTITVTHSYYCNDCGEITDVHVDDGTSPSDTQCSECGSTNTHHVGEA